MGKGSRTDKNSGQTWWKSKVTQTQTMIQEGQWRSDPSELKVRCSGKNCTKQLDPAADVWQLSVVTAAMRQTAPLETLTVFFLCFPQLLWPPSHPQTLGRPAERFVSPAADFTNKISSPAQEVSKLAFRRTDVRGINFNSNSGLEREMNNEQCLFYNSSTTDRKATSTEFWLTKIIPVRVVPWTEKNLSQ